MPSHLHPGSRVASIGTDEAGGTTRRRYVGIKTCDEALTGWAGNSADGWAELRAKRSLLAGRLTRLRGRLSTELDEAGNPIPVRRHHPNDPRRLRGRRFSVEA
jgi:hypothetical protein